MSKLVDRIGEINIANNGMQMQIIAYRGTYDVDIQFEDGVIVRNRSYKNFKSGCIKYPTPDRTGEVKIATNGMKMEIIAYRSSNDLDVRFEDGTIVKNKDYYRFKEGCIKNPNFNIYDRVGETNTAKNGMKMKIVRYNGNHDIDVQFEDGVIVKGKQYYSFKDGTLRYPTIKIGETGISKGGMFMKIIACRNHHDIDVQFEDGTIIKNKSYGAFKKGAIKNPNMINSSYLKKVREGMVSVANNGMKMKLINYRNAEDIDIQFEDGIIVTNKSFYRFKNGAIKYPVNALGEKNISRTGIRMRIYEFRSCSDIDVQFEDGLVVKHKLYKKFKKGVIPYNGIKSLGNKVEGNYCGFILKAIAYRKEGKVYYVCEDKYGNKDILTPQQMLEKSGVKAVF